MAHLAPERNMCKSVTGKSGSAGKPGVESERRSNRRGPLEGLAHRLVVRPLTTRIRISVARPIQKRLAKSRRQLKRVRAELVASRKQVVEVRCKLEALESQVSGSVKTGEQMAAEMARIRQALDALRAQSAERAKEALAMAEIVERSLLTVRLRAAPENPDGHADEAIGRQ